MRSLILSLCVLNIYFLDAHPQILDRNACVRIEECKVSGVYLTYSSGLLFVSWTAPSGNDCPDAKDYRVSYCLSPGECEGPYQTIAPGVPMSQIDIGELYCEQLDVMISTLDASNEVLANSDDIPLARALPNPTEISVQNEADTLRVSWKPIWDVTVPSCTVEYKIKYGDGEEVTTEETTEELTIPGLSFCTSQTVEITATSNGLTSDTVPATHEIGIPAVEILKAINNDGNIFFDFQPIEDVPADCGAIQYKIVDKETTCFTNEFSVQAISSEGFTSEPSRELVQKTPRVVANLQAEAKTHAIHVNWEPPTGAENCNIVYHIYQENVGLQETRSTSATLTFSPPACVETTVEVSAVISNIKGHTSQKNVLGELNAVNDLQCSLNGDIECSWSKPDSSETCQGISYSVTYYDGKSIQTTSQSSTSFSFPTTSCGSSWITVQPQVYTHGTQLVGLSKEAKVGNCSFVRFW